MIKIIVNSDFTENYATNLTKGILAYSHKTGQPWALCRMPISFKKEQGLDGVVRWTKEWNADAVWSAERCRGFKDTLAAQDADDVSVFNKESIDTPWHYDMHSLVGWLRQLPPQTALMACDDTRANKIIEACQIAGLRVPKDIAVLGVDNDEVICHLSYPELSSISTDVFHAGYATAEYIDRTLKGEETDIRDIDVPFLAIEERMSTEMFATDDPYMLQVLEYIHSHLAAPLDTPSLIRLVPLSRRLLETRFKNATGPSIHKYVTTLRIQRFARLLISSDEPMDELAAQVGLYDPKNLARQFRTYMGMTPLEYKKRGRHK